MFTIPILATGFALAFMLSASTVRAQGAFDNLGTKVKPGQKVIVIDQQGRRTEGLVDTVSATALVVNFYRGAVTDSSLTTTRTFTPDEVWSVQKPGHIWDGAIKGAIVGLIPAGIFAAAECYHCDEGSFTAFTVGMGAAIGLGIDALFGPKTVYRRASRASRVSLAPIVGTRGRRGVAASIRF
jgi:hypothetical protein